MLLLAWISRRRRQARSPRSGTRARRSATRPLRMTKGSSKKVASTTLAGARWRVELVELWQQNHQRARQHPLLRSGQGSAVTAEPETEATKDQGGDDEEKAAWEKAFVRAGKLVKMLVLHAGEKGCEATWDEEDQENLQVAAAHYIHGQGDLGHLCEVYPVIEAKRLHVAKPAMPVLFAGELVAAKYFGEDDPAQEPPTSKGDVGMEDTGGTDGDRGKRKELLDDEGFTLVHEKRAKWKQQLVASSGSSAAALGQRQ